MRKNFINMLFATTLSAFLLAGCGDTVPTQDTATEGVSPSPKVEETSPTPSVVVETAEPATSEPTEEPVPAENFQAAIGAYSLQFADSWGALFELSGSSIPFYFVMYEKDEGNYSVSMYGIYHFEGDEVVQVYEEYSSGEPYLRANYDDNIVRIDSRASYGFTYKCFEYRDGYLQDLYAIYNDFGEDDESWINSYRASYQGGEWKDIDVETFDAIRNSYQFDQEMECQSFGDALVTYMLNKEASVPTAEPVIASYGEYMLYVSQFELVDGVLTVTFISDDGEPEETISYPVSETCSWECDGMDGMGTVFLRTTTYEELKADVDSWYNIYVNGEYYQSPGLLGIEVEDSVIVKVYSLYP